MKQGFTLIELLVVVLIIGILSSVALPQYTKAVEKARATEALQLLGDLATAEQIYQMGMNSYTSDLSMLDLQMPGLSGTTVINTKNFHITTNTTNGFTAYAERATNGVENVSEPKYAIMLNISTDGEITRWCGDTKNVAYATVSAAGYSNTNKYCKSIANNASGVIK